MDFASLSPIFTAKIKDFVILRVPDQTDGDDFGNDEILSTYPDSFATGISVVALAVPLHRPMKWLDRSAHKRPRTYAVHKHGLSPGCFESYEPSRPLLPGLIPFSVA